MTKKDFISLSDIHRKDIETIIKKGVEIKKNPKKYAATLKGKSLLMIFEAVSVRTRLSFEIGMYHLGGFASFYNIEESSIYEKTRRKEIVRPRQIVMYVLRKDLKRNVLVAGQGHHHPGLMQDKLFCSLILPPSQHHEDDLQ